MIGEEYKNCMIIKWMIEGFFKLFSLFLDTVTYDSLGDF